MEKSLLIIKMNSFEAYLSRKPIKNINVRIDRKGNVNVSAPIRCSLDYIQLFLKKKESWILKHRTLYQSSSPMLHTLQSGELHFYLGKPYSLNVQEHTGKSRIALEGDYLYCYVESDATYDTKRHLLTDWHHQQMQSLLPALIKKWETMIGVHAHQWIIRTMKTRWGTCNIIKKRICLNLSLIHQPLVCLEYVLVHELVHLLEASHNQRFYALMSQFMPEWKDYKRSLKNHYC